MVWYVLLHYCYEVLKQFWCNPSNDSKFFLLHKPMRMNTGVQIFRCILGNIEKWKSIELLLFGW